MQIDLMSPMSTGTPGNNGIWFELIGNDFTWTAGRPAVFIDRDGVLVEEVNYLHRIADVVLIDGGADTLKIANAKRLPVVMVTNQAGIGRGYYDWHDFATVNRHILARLNNKGAGIDAVIACPYHNEGLGTWRHENHPMRKPNPGMLQMAAARLAINLSASLIIGDKLSDLQAGKAAGLCGGIHVASGHGGKMRKVALAVAAPDFVVLGAQSIADPLVVERLSTIA